MTSPGLSEMFAYHATTMANTIKTSLVVFSRKVRRPALLLADAHQISFSAAMWHAVQLINQLTLLKVGKKPSITGYLVVATVHV